MIRIEEDKKSKLAFVTITQSVDSISADILKNQLIDCLKRYNTIEIKIAKGINTGLSGMQLLCALHKSAAKLKRQIRVHADFHHQLKEQAVIYGFLRHIPCFKDSISQCIWLNNSPNSGDKQ